MTDSDAALEAVAQAAERLIPELSERLRRHGLGEIEVVHGELRLRVAADPAVAAAGSTKPAVAGAAAPPSSAADPAGTAAAPDAVPVSSPAVGFFVYADGLGPGLAVAKGDELGHVEMLGIRHDVRAPRGGTVRHLVAESGEAVEYGQTVLELEIAEAAR
jgi:acetyl-CoA carboxylase biotin carboxyl carrier protein